MRALIQRVAMASVSVDGAVIAQIDRGLLVLLGVAPDDTAADGEWLAAKLAKLRIFADAQAEMNRSVVDCSGGLLVVSQFTLYANTEKGTRPSFNGAAHPSHAEPLYRLFISQLSAATRQPVHTGRFGALMSVALVNDGPVTLLIESKQRD